jgi:hypothetical protein
MFELLRKPWRDFGLKWVEPKLDYVNAKAAHTEGGELAMFAPPAFTATERKQLLQSFFALRRQRYDWNVEQCRLQDRDPQEGNARLAHYWEQYQAMSSQIYQLENQYKAGVPIIPLSRCPYCQAVNYHSLDDYDLDGLWWESVLGFDDTRVGESSVRPREQHRLCPHFWMLSGALTLGQSFTVAPMMVHPGPDVPFVVTRLFEQYSMRAVISSIMVGAHTAYPIVYYSETKPATLKHRFAE